MKLTGFVGPSYTLDSVNVDCQRCVNLYPEIIESGTGKDAQNIYLKHTPGLELLLTVGAGPIRCVHTDSAGHIFVVSGNQVFQLLFIGGIWSTSILGTISTSTGNVIAATMDPGTDRYTVFVDGDNNYLYSYPASGVEQFGAFAAFADRKSVV